MNNLNATIAIKTHHSISTLAFFSLEVALQEITICLPKEKVTIGWPSCNTADNDTRKEKSITENCTNLLIVRHVPWIYRSYIQLFQYILNMNSKEGWMKRTMRLGIIQISFSEFIWKIFLIFFMLTWVLIKYCRR